MVGIPGKSKGCHTCRRRKIKCDLAKPECQKCTKSGRVCEGYAKGAVFLNRTADGLMKRARLEEILPSEPTEFHLQPLAPSEWGSAMPPDLQQTPEYRREIERQFLDHYLAKDNTPEWPSPGTYVSAVMDLPRDWVLEPALQALCTTRVGRLTGDSQMIEQGCAAYILALRRLNLAVSHPEKALNDSTFAAAKVLNLHEVYEPTKGVVTGLYDHSAGLTTLIHLRGHSRHSSKATKLLLEASRYNSMIGCIQSWKHSPLARAEWRTTSYESITNFEQALYDIGFDIGNFLEDVQLFAMQQPVVVNDASNQMLAKKCMNIQDNFRGWLDKFIAWAPSPIYWTVPEENHCQISGQPNLEFPHLTIAHVLMDYWALRIVLNIVIDKLSKGMLHQQQPDWTYVPWTPELSRLHKTAQECTLPYQFDLADKIRATIPYCRRPEMGCVGPQRTMFPIRVALAMYRRSTGDIATFKEREFLDIMTELSQNSGLRFADGLKKRPPPEWAAATSFECDQGFLPTNGQVLLPPQDITLVDENFPIDPALLGIGAM